MFERTALPDGPRVITARLPGTRSVSDRRVRPGRLATRAAGQSGVAHFMEHITFKGTAAYPSTRAISEAIEGVGGSFNAATDRESTVYWVRVPAREAQRASTWSRSSSSGRRSPTRDRPRAVGHRRGDPLAISTIRRVRPDPLPAGDVRRGPARTRDLRRRGGHPGPAGETIRDFWAATYRPSNIVVAVAGDLDHATALDLIAPAFGTGNGASPSFDPAPALPAGESILLGKRDRPGPRLHRRPGRAPRPSRLVDDRRPQRASWGRG